MPTESDLDPLTVELMDAWDKVLPHQADIGRDLLKRYAEKHRHYHDLNFQRTKCGARDDRNTGLLVAVSLDFRTFAI